MELKLLKKEKEKISFIIKGTNSVFVNTLRRMIKEEVPTLAIEDIEIKNNTSALYDEILAHRLGLIPIKTDLKTYELPTECKCKGEGCAKCQLKLILKSSGLGDVIAEDIKSKDPKCGPVYTKMPIVKLFKSSTGQNQEIELIATARLGQGKEHMKWSSGMLSFQGYPEITIKKDCEDAVKACPVDVFEFKDNKLTIKDIEKCHLCLACQEKCPNGIEVKASETDFIIKIESWGQLEPKEMVTTSMDMIAKKCDDFQEALKAL